MIKRILVALAGTPFTSVAIRRAVELGQLHNAEVLGVTVVNRRRLRALLKARDTSKDVLKESRRLQLSEERMEKLIVELEVSCAEAGVKCIIKREDGDPCEQMISLARHHDVMIFGLRSLFEYDYLGKKPSGILSQIVSKGVRPIIAVSQQFRPIDRVLMAYSGSMESAKTIKLFMQLQLWRDMTLKIITCEHPKDHADKLLEDAADYCRAHGHSPEVEFIPGSPRKEILSHADEWNADMIVMGNSARSYLLRKVLGDTALHIIQNSELPLFLSQ